MSKGYTNVEQVQDYLGRTLDGAQAALCDRLIDAVEEWIDGYTGRQWIGSTQTVTDETHVVIGTVVYLDHAPVTAVTSVTVLPSVLATPGTIDPSSYGLLDAGRGKLYLYGLDGYLVRVSYTWTPDALPASINLAATMIVAEWLAPRLDGVSANVKSYSVGGEISVTYRDPTTGDQRAIPPAALDLLDNPDFQGPSAGVLFA